VLLLSRVKEMKDVNFVLEKQKKSIGISVISEGKKKRRRGEVLALHQLSAIPRCHGAQLSPVKT